MGVTHIFALLTQTQTISLILQDQRRTQFFLARNSGPLCRMLGVKLPLHPGPPRITTTDSAPGTDTEPETDAAPPRPPSRRSDMMTLLRMVTPLVES